MTKDRPLMKLGCTKKEQELLDSIQLRFVCLAEREIYIKWTLLLVHNNGCRLDFRKLLGFPQLDFVHDICGIIKHCNPNTGKLLEDFIPRCAR